MRIGLIARADKSGLSIQTWCFWRNMHPAATLVVDMAHLFGVQPDMSWFEGDENVTQWRPQTTLIANEITNWPISEQILNEFLDKVDVVFSVETFYNTYIVQRARELGKRTVLQPNYEHLVHLNVPDVPEPDCFGLPTDWHEQDIRRALPGREIVHLPVPVDRELLPYRPRTECRAILHTVGTSAEPDRNGTEILVEAMRLVKSDVQLKIFCQRPLQRIWNMGVPTKNVAMMDDTSFGHFWEVYDYYDVLVLPRRFGGLCLPAQEAMACGMPVIGTLFAKPGGQPFPVLEVGGLAGDAIYSKAPIETVNARPEDIAAAIDHIDVERASAASNEWAKGHSWSTLRPLYETILEG